MSGSTADILDLISLSEKGDAAAALQAAHFYAEAADEKAAEASKLMLERSYFLSAIRLNGVSLEEPPQAALEHMVSSMSSGEGAGDCVVTVGYCIACANEPDMPVCIFVGKSDYTTMEEMIGNALRACEIVYSQYLPPCPTCRSNMILLYADFFSDSFDSKQLFVVRCFFDGLQKKPISYGLLWWSPEAGYSSVSPDWPDETERCTTALERALKLRMLGCIDECAEIVEEAFVNYPGDPCFIHVVPLLQSRKHLALCQNIARSHIASFATDPLGYFCLAESLFRGFLGNHTAQSTLKQALENSKKALSLRRDWKEAELLYCMIMRFQNLPEDQVEKGYLDLLAKYPDFANAYLDYGLFLKDTFPDRIPDRSSEMMERAAALSPNESAYREILIRLSS